MVKTGCGLECDKENREGQRSDAKEEQDERKKTDGEKDLAEMETGGGGYVHIEIGVMNIMKSPKQREPCDWPNATTK
jgi:hypothetical protein